jgi:hypothetical protein
MARPDLENKLVELGGQSATQTVDQLLTSNLLHPIGSGLGISQFGHKVSLLVDAIETGTVDDLARRIRRLDGSAEPYELVRQGMTTRFLNSFVDRPYFGALYLCSPWINLNSKEAAMIRYGLMQSEKRTGRRPDIYVITRPTKEGPDEQVGSGLGLAPLVEMKADVTYMKKVHTKLYIREPDDNGGPALALVGSENLTQSKHLELGIQINGDGRLISQLVAHFFELTSYSG